MIISVDAENTFGKFMIKNTQLGIASNFLNLIKGIYKKPTANIVLKVKD